MRLTKPREVVFEIVTQSSSALRPDQIHSLARQKLPGIGLVTVYRTLDVLEKTGLTERVHNSDHCRAVTQVKPGHNHIIFCSSCGETLHFSGVDLSDLFSKVSLQTGFAISNHMLQLNGLCPRCRNGKNE